ncbi:MAG: 50S ribosomal protein L13 [Thermoplasmata archaeon]|nr:50S ribosomal protein L13 [Thermoplasmata archaeon]
MADEKPSPPEAPATPSTPSPAPAGPVTPAKTEKKPAAIKAPKAARTTTTSPSTTSKPAIQPKSALSISKGPIAWKSSTPAAKVKKAATGPAPTVVDVTGLILGRSASLIAQRLLKGENIVVINAEKVLITGSRPRVLNFYIANRARGSVRSGPHFPRYPDRIYRRTVRGMLPHLKTRGKMAYDRLEVFIGCPSGYQTTSHDWLAPARAKPSVRALLTLGEVSKLLGARL